MEIKSSVELDNGSVEFSGVLDQEETTFLLEFAINHLLAMGVSPFMAAASQDTDGHITKESLN